MTFPHPELGAFEGENGRWCNHYTQEFMNRVTMPEMAAQGCDAHKVFAHLMGALVCAIGDAGGRHEHVISDEMIDLFRDALRRAERGEFNLSFPTGPRRPRLTPLTGGKQDDPEPDGAA